MLGSLKVQTRNCWIRIHLGGRKDVGDDHYGGMERDMCDRQNVRRLCGNHTFAAIMTLHRRIAGHGTAALHALFVLRHCGNAIRELQAQ
jgi:hypothetical protein